MKKVFVSLLAITFAFSIMGADCENSTKTEEKKVDAAEETAKKEEAKVEKKEEAKVENKEEKKDSELKVSPPANK